MLVLCIKIFVCYFPRASKKDRRTREHFEAKTRRAVKKRDREQQSKAIIIRV